MRAFVFLAVFIVLALLAPPGRDAAAKGGAVAILPDSGELGTQVELWSTDWIRNAEVRLYAAFSSSLHDGYTGSAQYVGPVATVRSNDDGDWEAQLSTDALAGLLVPNEPGFLYFRADSDDLPSYLENANTTHFVVEWEDQRPEGSGEILVSISSTEEPFDENSPLLVWFGWRQAGRGSFQSPYAVVPVPFTVTLDGKADGEWEVTVLAPDGYEVVGNDGPLDTVRAAYCGYKLCATQDLSIRRVTVMNAGKVEARFILQPIEEGDVAAGGSAASTHQEGGGATANDTAGLIVAASVLLTLLIAGGYMLTRRRG